jgi:hypothetical protein
VLNIHVGKRFMDILEAKTTHELNQSLVAELAKATAELRCAKDDLAKVSSRLSFVLAVVNTMINRQKD